jgi:hypothetical protein
MPLRLLYVFCLTAAAFSFFLPSLAFADSNFLNIIQDGDTHHGLVIQTGLANQAGTNALPVHQQGVFDDLTLRQSGNDNTIGLTGHGLVQNGTASIDGSAANSATIIQNSNGNTIGELVQTTLGTHPTTGNTLAVTEDYGRDGGASGQNTIGSISQVQDNADSANFAILTQTGADNWLDRVSQQTSSGEGANHVTLAVTGDYNGIDDGTLAHAGSLAILARSVGASSASIIQDADLSGGAENTIALTITGNYNQFGLTQRGTDNSVGEEITGNGNSFGAYQSGHHNQLVAGGIAGDGNDLGTSQTGHANTVSAVLNWSSSDNEVGIGQNGDSNAADLSLKGDNGLVAVSQDGRGHDAGITTIGDRDVLLAVQYNPGRTASIGNSMTVNVAGDGNNGLDGLAAASFTGDALAAAAKAIAIPRSLVISPDPTLLVGSLQGGLVLVPGLLVQWGDADTIDIEVGATGPSNDNLFAVEQKGDGNLITASVNGSNNQFVITQIGDDDIAAINQDGNGNIAVISQ